MRIAVIGGGISGLVAAHYLQQRHRVTLFEARPVAGGHTNTVTVMEGERPVPVDTGFIVFNTKTYPRFVSLLGELGVGWAPSDMSLSVRSERRDFEYNGRNLSTLFAQRRRALSPRFLRMVADIFRFYRQARALLGEGADFPLLPWLRSQGYSEAFIEDHLVPLLRAVWSADRETAESFPARFFVRFFDHHGFLQVRDQPQWLTIPGGAQTYVRAILSRFQGRVLAGAAVQELERNAAGVVVRAGGREPERFDHAVVAAHSDQALALLKDPHPLERELLGAIRYQHNEAVLHTDPRVMPRRRRAWASWNVHLDDQGVDGACLSYWMNQLQPLHAARDYFVTLNYRDAIDPAKVLHVERYAHPVFSRAAVEAQARHAELIDVRHTSYCGAYWRNGFHEDGVVSALRVVERLSRSEPSAQGAAA